MASLGSVPVQTFGLQRACANQIMRCPWTPQRRVNIVYCADLSLLKRSAIILLF